MKPNLVIFASGNGSNALNIIQYFKNTGEANVAAIFTNKRDAGVVTKAIDNGVPIHYFNRADFYETENVIELVGQYDPKLIILAGFLWLVPSPFIRAFKDKIINIHPALLPEYGGKGMYGQLVHEAVLKANETESGITIHKVNEKFDEGEILFQVKCQISANDTVETLSNKIHQLEQENFPKVISKLLKNA